MRSKISMTVFSMSFVDVIRLFGQPERVHLGAEHVDRGADGLVGVAVDVDEPRVRIHAPQLADARGVVRTFENELFALF